MLLSTSPQRMNQRHQYAAARCADGMTKATAPPVMLTFA